MTVSLFVIFFSDIDILYLFIVVFLMYYSLFNYFSFITLYSSLFLSIIIFITTYCYQYYLLVFISFFFFKQKTAYEMRISDWSSDVCSSDLLGPYSSGMTKAIAPVTEKYQIPMVQAEGASRSLFTQGYKYMFAILSTSELYLASTISLLAEQAEAMGKKTADVKVAMAFENDPFSLDVRAGVVEDVKKFCMNIVVDDKLPRDLADMTGTLTKVKALKPDLLLVSGHEKGAATAVRQIAELNVDVPMIAITHCESAAVVEEFGKAADGILCPTQWSETLSYKDPYFGTAAQYEADFKKVYPEYKAVPYQTAQGSAAILVFKDAFERAGSFDKEKVREALAQTEMETFYGAVKFSEAGNNIAKPMVLRQIQDGEYNVVAPTTWASSKLESPRKAAD